MADLNWALLLRTLILLAIIAVFCISLIGILLTGPIVVRTRRLDLNVDVSTERLEGTVLTLCEEFTPRNYVHRENLERAAKWIEDRFRETDLTVQAQDYELRVGRYRNVIASQVGSDASAGAIVMGAHYDVYGESAGANDNASGVAVLLELARTLPQKSPRRTRYFVAFCTEEPPFFGSEDMGSYVFAQSLLDQDVKVDLMIALDLVGHYSDEPGSQRFPFPGLGFVYPDRANFIAVVGDLRSGRWIGRVKHAMLSTRSLPVHSFRGPRLIPGVDWSDHYSFRRLRLPGVLITDTAFMRYSHYHTLQDTPEKLDYTRMGQLVRALHGVLWEGPPP
jgi:hypothetical protein